MISCSTNTINTQTGKAYIQPHHTNRQGIHSAVRLKVCLGRQELLERQTDKTWTDIRIPCPFQWNMQHVVCPWTKFGCESRREVPVYRFAHKREWCKIGWEVTICIQIMSREMWNWDLLQLWGYIVKTIHVPYNWSMIDKTTVEPKAKDRFKNPAVVVLSWIETKLDISLQFQCLGQVDNDIMCIFFDFSKLHKKSMSIFVPWAYEKR